MSDKEYIWKNIRRVLADGLATEDLKAVYQDEAKFRVLRNRLPSRATHDEIVDKLVDFAERRLLIDRLLELVQTYDADVYAEYGPYWQGQVIEPPPPEPDPDPESASSPKPTPSPETKDIFIKIDHAKHNYQVDMLLPDGVGYSNLPLRLDPDALQGESDPARYGRTLGQALFADARATSGWRQMLAVLQSHQQIAQIRLQVDVAELQALHWERLQAPRPDDGWQVVARNAKLPLSRHLTCSIPQPRPVSETPRRVLALVASPSGLDEQKFAPIPATERATLKAQLEALPQTELIWLESETDALPTLANLRAALLKKPHVVLMVAHGTLGQSEAALLLSDASGQAEAVSTIQLADALREAEQTPQLVVLAACETAAPDLGMAPILVERGHVPAVLAMRQAVSMATIYRLLPYFFGQLFQHGLVDLALTQARAQVQDSFDWSVLVLFSRLKGNRLFESQASSPLAEAGAGASPTEASAFKAVKRQNLQAELDLLTQQYQAVSQQRLLTLGAGQKVVLGQQLEHLEKQIEAIQQKLAGL